MAATNRDPKRDGAVERAAAVVPPPAGRAFRFVVVSLLAVSTGALVAVAVLAALIYQRVGTVDVASLKSDIAGVKTETASFHADVAKAMASLQKSMADTANEVNSATLQLNDIALSLHRKP
ncbi:hypothetical protein [Lichenibacterium dinghuense]|uniref:hypothetical protein n=1 Tax=Lichenibacterium dinghuense TaxID=2895977 RepID=UPI001F3E2CB9|nr:hypothetical protein [Lichenibacterium sp. 6Y81]